MNQLLMLLSKRRALLSAGLTVVALIAACGGGGSGDGSGGTPAVAPPVITTQPASVTVSTGGSATFAVGASGVGLAYQWQRSTSGGATWTDIASASGASYTIASVDAAMNGHRFRVVVGNVAGTVASDGATLVVSAAGTAPSITRQPTDQVVVAPAPATFSITVSGTPMPMVQWQVSLPASGSPFQDIPGASGTSYTTPPSSAADDGASYRAIVSNASGSVATSAARLTVSATSLGGFPTGLAFAANGELVFAAWVNAFGSIDHAAFIRVASAAG